MNRIVFNLELKSVLLRPAGLILLVTLTVLAGVALHAGYQQSTLQADANRRHAETTEGTWQAWRADLAGIEAGTVEATPLNAKPINVRYAATLPPGPLGDFAIGLSEIHPGEAVITPRQDVAGLFPTYPFENPDVLSLGRFDFALFVVILVPLAMIVLCFDAMGADRQSGRMPMLAAQNDRIGRFVWSRLVVRSAAVWLPVALVATIALFANAGDAPFAARVGRFALFAGATAIYAGFWFAVIAFAVAFIRRSTVVATSLLTIWLLLVFGIPAATSALRDTANPLPSRLTFLSEMRTAESEAARSTQNLTDQYFTDHPELTIEDEEAPRWHRDVFVTNLAVNERLVPVFDTFESRRANRARTTGIAQFASPSMVALNALVAIADGDALRAHRFQSEAREHLLDLSERLGPSIMSGGRITGDEADSLPAFEFRDPSILTLAQRYMLPVGIVFLVSLLLGGIARVRLRTSIHVI